MDGFFPDATVSHWIGSVGFVLTTWLGAYLASHVPRNLPSRLAILSLFTLSGYFLHVILCLFLPADRIGHIWRRFMGWLALLPLLLWLHLTSLLLSPKQYAQQRLLILSGSVIIFLMAWILYWPITVNWLKLPWSLPTGLAVGDSLPLVGALILAYTVAYHSAFMAGCWVKRDFFFHAVTVISP